MNTAKQSSTILTAKLDGVRTKRLGLALGTGVAWLVAAAVSMLSAGMIADWKWDFSHGIRQAMLALDALVLLIIAARHIAHPLLNQADDETVALEVEHARPEFRSRLIASTQLTGDALPAGTSKGFVAALVKQTETMARSINFNSIVPNDAFALAAVMALLLGSLGGLAFNRYQPDTGVLLRRAFLSNEAVPRFTHIQSVRVNPKAIIARGDDVELIVTLNAISRVNPESADIYIQYDNSDRSVKYTAVREPAAHPAEYRLKLENVRESFRVDVRAHDARAKESVTVVPRPAVQAIQFRQHYPSYTGLPSQDRRRGDLVLLAGGKLQIKVVANKPVTGGHVTVFRSSGESGEFPLGKTGSDHELRLTVPMRELDITSFSVKLVDQHGFDSRDEAVYRVAMMPDEPPVVRVLQPVGKEEKVTQRARLPIMISVKDDYGVAQLALKYTDSTGRVRSIPLQPEKKLGRQARVAYDWQIVDLKPRSGEQMEYWIEATDACAPRAGVSQSRRLLASVVTDDEKRQDLQNRATDSITGVNQTAEDQEKLNRELGEIIRARAGSGGGENE
ncbi:MAG: hypothetical protein H8E27_01235 [Verrucomicrobia subdivision 3 bacterium]|nr:hypothetical protein [Limisphaerales bacterium]